MTKISLLAEANGWLEARTVSRCPLGFIAFVLFGLISFSLFHFLFQCRMAGHVHYTCNSKRQEVSWWFPKTSYFWIPTETGWYYNYYNFFFQKASDLGFMIQESNWTCVLGGHSKSSSPLPNLCFVINEDAFMFNTDFCLFSHFRGVANANNFFFGYLFRSSCMMKAGNS